MFNLWRDDCENNDDIHNVISFFTRQYVLVFIPFRTAVPFWGQTTQISSSLSPKRDCCSTGLCSVGELYEYRYPYWGMTHRNFQGRGIIVPCCTVCVRQSGKRWRSLIFVWWFFRFDCSCFTACPRVVTLTAPQTSSVYLPDFSTTVRFVRCRQNSRQQSLYPGATSWLAVGTGETPCCIVERIYARPLY